jgi:hypothetical protein
MTSQGQRGSAVLQVTLVTTVDYPCGGWTGRSEAAATTQMSEGPNCGVHYVGPAGNLHCAHNQIAKLVAAFRFRAEYKFCGVLDEQLRLGGESGRQAVQTINAAIFRRARKSTTPGIYRVYSISRFDAYQRLKLCHRLLTARREDQHITAEVLNCP